MDEAIAHCTRGLGIWDRAEQRRGRRAGRGAGLLPATSRRSRPSPRRTCCASSSGPEGPGRQRGRPDAAPAATPSTRTACPTGIRRAVHDGQADHLRLPRLPVADPPPDLPAHEPRQPARPRLQGGGHDDDAVRHGHAERLDRFHLAIDVIDRVPGLADARGRPRQQMAERRLKARAYTRDMARTTRRSATGPGRTDGRVLVVNAGSTEPRSSPSSDGDERALARGRPSEVAGSRSPRRPRGRALRAPVLIRRRDRRDRAAARLAPLHNAAALEAIREAHAALPDVPHVAVFDTAFHATLPEAAATYAVPKRWRDEWGIRATGSTVRRSGSAEQRRRPGGSSSATSAAAAR